MLFQKKKANLLNKKIIFEVKKYLPNLNIVPTGKFFISPRVLLSNVKKSDRRISYVKEVIKGYFQIFPAKVDHSIEIAKQLIKLLKKKTNYSY